MNNSLLHRILAIYRDSPRVAILMSGKGSNADVILSNARRYTNLKFMTVCTDREDSNARIFSEKYNLSYYCQEGDVGTQAKRDIYFETLAAYLRKEKIDTVIYAGFMKISTKAFVEEFPGFNVHPADLTIRNEKGEPVYVGMDALGCAVRAGETYLASTAHVVDCDVDCGAPIMVSKHLSLEGRNINDHARLHEQLKISVEHLLFPRVIELMSKGLLVAEQTPYRWHELSDELKINNGSYFSDKLLALKEHTTPLDLAYLSQDYSSEVGFDFTNIEQVMAKVKEEFNEMSEAFENRQHDFDHFVEEIGDCFFSLVNLCRFIQLHPEAVVKRNVLKYLNRCVHVERQLSKEGRDWSQLSHADIIKLWKEAKKA